MCCVVIVEDDVKKMKMKMKVKKLMMKMEYATY